VKDKYAIIDPIDLKLDKQLIRVIAHIYRKYRHSERKQFTDTARELQARYGVLLAPGVLKAKKALYADEPDDAGYTSDIEKVMSRKRSKNTSPRSLTTSRRPMLPISTKSRHHFRC
jgi:hypothetical protein